MIFFSSKCKYSVSLVNSEITSILQIIYHPHLHILGSDTYQLFISWFGCAGDQSFVQFPKVTHEIKYALTISNVQR